jgi:hypothetical protein
LDTILASPESSAKPLRLFPATWVWDKGIATAALLTPEDESHDMFLIAERVGATSTFSGQSPAFLFDN